MGDCSLCHLPAPAEWCWQHRWDCPVTPPRHADTEPLQSLWQYLKTLETRIATLEKDE